MAKGDLMSGVRTSQTICHEARSVPGREGSIDLALFTGHIVYASGETATFAGVEVIDTTDGKDTFGRFASLRGGGPFKWAVNDDEYRAEFSA